MGSDILRKSIIEVTLALAVIIIYWLTHRYALEFYAALGFTLLAAISMAVYLLFTWRKLSGLDRRQGAFALVGWLVMAYAIIHADGLTVRCFFY